MSYVCIDLEFENPDDLCDLTKRKQLYLEIVNAVPKQNLLGSNFNGYWDPESRELHPHISFRLRLKDVEASRPDILKKGDQLVSSGRIRFHGKLKEWPEPEFVAKAHELGTECFLIMLDELEKTSELAEFLNRNYTEFTLHSLPEMLKRIGFKFNIPWTYLRSKPTLQLEEAAARLAELLKRTGEGINPDFLERFLHAFLNCFGFSGFEDKFLLLLMKGRAWRDLAYSRQGEG